MGEAMIVRRGSSFNFEDCSFYSQHLSNTTSGKYMTLPDEIDFENVQGYIQLWGSAPYQFMGVFAKDGSLICSLYPGNLGSSTANTDYFADNYLTIDVDARTITPSSIDGYYSGGTNGNMLVVIYR